MDRRPRRRAGSSGLRRMLVTFPAADPDTAFRYPLVGSLPFQESILNGILCIGPRAGNTVGQPEKDAG